MNGVITSMLEVRVPKLYPTLSQRDWFKVTRWYTEEGKILQPGDMMVEIECAPGIFDVITPPEVTSPHRVVQLHVPAGSPTHLGELIITLEPVA